MKIAPLSLDDVTPWARLLATAFNRQPEQMSQLLHFLQPETHLVAWGAWDGDSLAAQYSCLLRQLYSPTQDVNLPVGLSINMAVHPHYRGQGLIKQVAQPVYEHLAAKKVVAGVGFSNAAGVQVDKRSSSYGYRVVGQLRSYLLWLGSTAPCPDFELTTLWPEQPFQPVRQNTAVQFAWTSTSLRHRFACHPFRKYHFGVWHHQETIAGIVVYRPTRLFGLPAVGLLAIYGNDHLSLLQRWMAAVKADGYRWAYLVSTPQTSLLHTLRQTAVCLPQPISRTPYYLTLKPLTNSLPPAIFDFENWACLGGDIL